MRWALAWLLCGCTVPALDLDGKSCPCANGYVCVESTQRCAPDPASGDACEGIAGAIFCEDFESGLDSWTIGGGSPTLHSTVAHQSETSLRSDGASFLLRPIGEVPDRFFMRVYAYFESDPRFSGPPTMFFSVDASDEPLGASGASIGMQGEDPLIRVGQNAEGESGRDLVEQEWICLEAMIDRQEERGVLYMNGEERVEAFNDGWRLEIDEVVIGAHPINNLTPMVTVLLDDAVVATERIGCD